MIFMNLVKASRDFGAGAMPGEALTENDDSAAQQRRRLKERYGLSWQFVPAVLPMKNPIRRH